MFFQVKGAQNETIFILHFDICGDWGDWVFACYWYSWGIGRACRDFA
jgi:hypothetical protein